MPQQRELVTGTIASAGTQSSAINTGPHRIAGLIMPAGWDAANITFQMTPDGTNWYDVYNDAATPAIMTLTGPVAAKYYAFMTVWWALEALGTVRLVASAAQNGGARILTLVLVKRA